MKTPDKHIIDRALNNTATPEEARQVIRWFSTPEGTKYLSSLMDEDAEKIQPATKNCMLNAASLPMKCISIS